VSWNSVFIIDGAREYFSPGMSVNAGMALIKENPAKRTNISGN
jgi:hypothetical protein